MKLGYEHERSRKSKKGVFAQFIFSIGQSIIAIALLAVIIFKVPQLAPIKEVLVAIFEKAIELYNRKGSVFFGGVVILLVSVWFAVNKERTEMSQQESIRQDIRNKAISDLIKRGRDK